VLNYKIMIKLFVLNCMSEGCLCALYIVSPPCHTRNTQEAYNMLLNMVIDENYILRMAKYIEH
jgi:hypothetical protein